MTHNQFMRSNKEIHTHKYTHTHIYNKLLLLLSSFLFLLTRRSSLVDIMLQQYVYLTHMLLDLEYFIERAHVSEK